MNVRNITTAVASLMLITVLSTACRHHREVVYVNGTPPPATTTVVYNNTPPPVNNTVVYTNNQQQPTPPVVSIVYPATNYNSPGNYITVRGNVQNILLAHQINVSQNGYPVRFFSYDPFNGNFHFQTFLQQGANNIIVTANNAYGTGSQGITVLFNPSVTYMQNGGNYPNNSINPNANVVPNGGNYPNNSINPNAINTNGGGNYPNNSINPNAIPNGGNYPNNSINPNAVNPNGGGNYPNNSINPNANGGGNNQGQGRPFIQYTNPSSTPAIVTVANYNVSALVQNVANANQITVNVNGSTISSFNFNPYSHSLNFGVNNLLTGFNSIHISATNSSGTTSQSTVIDYKPTASVPPRIAVFNPATSPFSSLQQNMIVSGYVYNVTSSSEISATFNGSPISFNYNQNTQEIEVPVNLTANSNQLVITANNPSGTDSKPVTLLLVTNTPHTGQQNPNVHAGGVIYIDQNTNGTNNAPHTGQQNSNLQTAGGVIYIDQNMNGTNNAPHTGQQNPNLQTAGGATYIDQNMNGTNNAPHTGQQNPNLQTAGGAIYIDQHLNASSGGNSSNAQPLVKHAPEITRTSPATSPYTTMSGVISAAANVNFVTNGTEVSVTYNGSPVSFSYNPQVSEALNFTSPLSPGMNTFVIKATNAYGTTTQDISVNYVPTNTSGNTNGNPNLHFTSGVNVTSNTPRELNTTQRTEPAKANTSPAKTVQPNNGKQAVKPK
jgi:hypothetical protein